MGRSGGLFQTVVVLTSTREGLLLHLPSYNHLWCSPVFFFFFFCVSQLYLWGSPFSFFFCVPCYISGVHHSSSSSSAFPSYISGVHHSSSSSSSFPEFPAISRGFTILLLLPSQLYLWGSPFFFFFCVSQLYLWSSPVFFFFFFFFCVPQQYLWGSPFFFFSCVSHLYHWGSPFFFFFCIPGSTSGVHHSFSSSTAFPAVSLGIIILRLLLRSQLYLWGLPFFFFCVP